MIRVVFVFSGLFLCFVALLLMVVHCAGQRPDEGKTDQHPNTKPPRLPR